MAPDPRPEIFTAISHPVRRRILDLLAEEDHPVNAIASNFDVMRGMLRGARVAEKAAEDAERAKK